jgi:hypothetical protein
MLSFDSPAWSELDHAYGNAADIPDLLRQLETLPVSEGKNEPWFSIWSSLAHQGDVYSASFAAVPHIINYLSQNPIKADSSYFDFPAWIEICRQKKSVPIPKELEADYFEALAKLPFLVASASNRTWDSDFLRSSLSAIAAAKGFASVAEAVSEMTPEISKKFLEWFCQQ